jgi:nitrate reductase (NAD(P)H)
MPVLSTSNPDSWVPRDPKALIPVTGSFPYNAEPSADKLLDDLVTPNHLHYVRNHGAVPHLEYHTHLLTIDGLVDRPRVWRMDELEDAFDPKSVVVTIACDGNRRKELNVKHPTCGSNFAAGTVSTARWTGVSLRDLLDIAQGQRKWLDDMSSSFYSSIGRKVCHIGRR